jgi:predicted tellurium resistance membrane protein TerC
MESILTADGILSLLTLTVMEIVLGIDNVIFISILTDRIEPKKQKIVRQFGLILALAVRLILLATISFLTGIKQALFTITWGGHDHDFTLRHIILLFGGIFLIYKSTTEIHSSLEGEEVDEHGHKKKLTVANAIFQIVLLDLVFSFDSILTAVGLSGELFIMASAVIVSMIFMLMSSKKIANFINSHPTVKMLALSFLMTIGVILVSEGLHQEIPKGYVYYSLGFSLLVELLNMKMRRNAKKVVELKKKME